MRLRLTVQRQSLPPVRILWTVGGLRLGLDSNATSVTVSQFLEQVNEVIPLEAEYWGLEDYVVEVRGFECLHFSGLGQVLKDDDEVTIRPLQTTDLRYRKISGRHQISADGRHLIDGVAFGRQFLRHADRPTIRIPPRKRLRLTNDDEDGREENAFQVTNRNHQVVVRAGSNDGDNERLYDSEEDEDFSPDDEDRESLGAELEDIMGELQHIGGGNGGGILEDVEKTPHLHETREKSGRITRSRRRQRQQGLGLQGESILALVDENGRQYPGEYHNPLLEQYYENQPAQPTKKRSKQSRIQKFQSSGIQQSTRRPANIERISRRSSSASVKNVRFQNDESKTPATVIETDDTEGSNDQSFDPNEVAENNSSESNKENVEPDGEDTSDSDSSSSSTSITSKSDSSETSSSLSSSSIVSSDSASRISSVENVIFPTQRSKSTLDKPKSHTNKDTPANGSHSVVPPGQGKRETQKRNQRRRDRKLFLRLKNIRVLPSSATKEDYVNWNRSRIDSEQTRNKSVEEYTEKDTELAAAFEARRQSLLESIAGSGVEVTSKDVTGESLEQVHGKDHNTIEPLESTVRELDPLVSLDGISRTPTTTGDISQAARRTESNSIASIHTPDVIVTPELITQPASEPTQQRSRLDLASSRRMLFGSLGLRTPQNKADESKIRDKLMQRVKPLPQIQDKSKPLPEARFTAQTSDTDESWKNKIILKAVECCHDGIQLSIPPFPFVQRWDPQQQRGTTTSNGLFTASRGKKRKRNNPQFSNQDWESYANETAQVAEDWDQNHEGEERLEEIRGQQQEDSRALSDEYQVAVDEQLMRDTHELSATAANHSMLVSDLPDLPADLNSCVSLDKDVAVPGAIISFKQLEMSQETQWQPQISGYKTAMIDRVGNSGRLEMTLAQRDRPIKERHYDEHTGERLYSKFEAPDEDDESNEDESGFIELSLEEMIEPRLIKAAKSEQRQQPDQEHHIAAESVDHATIPDAIEKSYHVDDIEHGDITEQQDVLMANTNENLSDQGTNQADHSTLHIQPEQESAELTEEARNDIVIMIKDAGFRSNIHSEIDQGLENHELSKTLDTRPQASPKDSHFNFSPKFNGFSSTPPAEQSSKMALDSMETAARSPSVYQQKLETSPPAHPVVLSQGQVEDKGSNGRRAFHDLDDDDDDLYMSSAKHAKTKKSDYVGSRERGTTSVSPTLSVGRVTIRSTRGQNAQHRKGMTLFDGANSDSTDNFPTLEEICSAPKSYLEVSITDDKDIRTTGRSRRAIPKEKKGLEKNPQSRTPSHSHSQTPSLSQSQSQQTKKSFSIAEVLASSNGEDSDYEIDIPPGDSQAPIGSQIVDLTFSSDAVDPDDSEYEDRTSKNRLPTGPGWVQKSKGGRKSEVARKKKREKLGTRKTRSM